MSAAPRTLCRAVLVLALGLAVPCSSVPILSPEAAANAPADLLAHSGSAAPDSAANAALSPDDAASRQVRAFLPRPARF